MNELPLVSVIIPCLNRAQFLAPTVDSVLAQNYPHIECIVMDGGSTDGTVEILQGYGDRIRWVSQPDDGQADAINKGWSRCQGDILTWLNADDVWVAPDAVSHAVAYLQAHPDVGIVYGDCAKIDLEGNLVSMTYLHEWDLIYAVANADHCIPQPAAFIRRAVLERIGWLDTSFILMDIDLWYRAGQVTRIRYLPVLTASARDHPSYWHPRSYITASDRVRISKKIFDNPDLPTELRALQRRAMSNAHLRASQYAWIGRHWDHVFGHLGHAVREDPANTLNTLRHLIGYAKAAVADHPRLRWLLTLYEGLRRAYHLAWPVFAPRSELAYAAPRTHNIERTWVNFHIPSSSSGAALDFGADGNFLGLVAAQRGFRVTAVDGAPVEWPYIHPRLEFMCGDIHTLPLASASFDLILNCGTIASAADDLETMARLRDLLKPGGLMLLTAPVGTGVAAPGSRRLYDSERLEKLLDGFQVEKADYWIKRERGNWASCSAEVALSAATESRSRAASRQIHAVGCFALRKPH